jgi:hypothetical protein
MKRTGSRLTFLARLTLVCALALTPVAQAQSPTPTQTSGKQDVTIVIQQQQVRFTTPQPVEQMHLLVTDPAGEVVFDSGAASVLEINWQLQYANGTPLKSGLYAYTLTLKAAGEKEARVRRGHFIVDRAQDRDGADKLWVTSPNTSGIGTELTVARDESAVIAGTRTISDRTSGRDTPTRSLEGEATEQGVKPDLKAAVAAAPAGTIGRIAKFISATELGDSLISESVNGVQLPNGVQLGVGAQGNQVAFGSPNGETGMSIAGTSGRADLRFDGTLKLVAGLGGVGPPPATNGIAITTAGNVGIGTVTPLAGNKLDVRGSSIFNPGGSGGGFISLHTPNAETGMTINGNGTTRADLRFDGSTLKLVASSAGIPAPSSGVAITTAGNVGIGTGAPATKLHVESPGFAEIAIKSTNERAILSLNNGLNPQGYVWTIESGVGGRFPSLFGIYNRNVGRSGLEIDGNLLVYVKALQINGGADFAENFDVRTENPAESAAEIQPGMVVAIDPANPGKLSLGRRAYDRRVAGIISGAGGVQPGMTMGQEQTLADGKHPVALSGRVYCWVDATRGAVKPGDLLTTSATPGHAMKVTNSPRAQGAILGKAMTGLKTGKGLVLVLVTLQ